MARYWHDGFPRYVFADERLHHLRFFHFNQDLG